ncbi:hypothetical protein H0H87_006855 [Tephrocybe sp. NHM501043]|nr:hypothetical protein H0H87_006855 [Tephrocybe sp. NHM501043]
MTGISSATAHRQASSWHHATPSFFQVRLLGLGFGPIIMIHIDPNHLSSTNLISDKIVSWEKPFDSFIPDTGNQPDTRPVPDSTTSATHSPTDGNTASPGRDRSSSLSPAPETGSRPDSPRKEEEEEEEPSRVEPASRLSTPLSELSPPPPDQDDEPGPPAKPKEEVKEEVDETQKEEPPKPEPTPSLESPVTPTTASNAPSDPKVVSILELNLELLRCAGHNCTMGSILTVS